MRFDISDYLSRLDPKKQELLRLMLKEEGISLAQTHIVRQPRTRPHFPASYAQQGLWFLERMDAGSGLYNVVIPVYLSGKLEKQLLEHSIDRVIQRHENLRTTFHMLDDQLTQVIGSAWQMRLPLINLTTHPGWKREQCIQQIIKEEAHYLLDLERGPLLRACIVRLEQDTHLIIFTMHHIISDRWSWGVLLQELQICYTALAQGGPIELADLPIQYADYAVWQRSWLESATAQKQLEYWQQQLAGVPAVMPLPLDRPRPAQRSGRGALLPFTLSVDLTAQIRAFCRSAEVTPFMALLAAFKVLLFCYTHQGDIVVGSPVANRTHSELEPLIGYFINTVVLRTWLTPDNTFYEVVQTIRKVTTEAYARQEMPFDKLVEALRPVRHTSYTPVFQVVFAYQNTPMPALTLPQLTLTPAIADTGLVPYDVILTFEDMEQVLTGSLEYNTDIFEADTIQRLQENLLFLLRIVLAHPDQPLSTLSIPTVPPWPQALIEQPVTTLLQNSTPQTVHQLIEAQVERTPNRPAIRYRGESMSYKQLNHLANRLARRLRKLGVGPETLVVVALERSLELVIALLGVWKAGGAYIPVDPTHPIERLTRILHSVHPSLLLGSAQLAHQLDAQNLACRILTQEQLSAELYSSAEPADKENLPCLTLGDNLAYVIYTSGSTGQPKGVQIPHHAVVNLLLSTQQEPGLFDTDTMVAITTITFDIAALELFLPLLVGACVVLAEQKHQGDAQELQALIRATNATVMQATPITWRLLLDAGWSGHPQFKALCGGEALPLDLARQLRSRVGVLWNMYGPTETTIWSSVGEVERNPQVITLGKPTTNTQLYLLDEQMRPIRAEEVGELYISGLGLSRGYLQQPDLTAERFVPNPLAQQPGQRLYRTGDLGRLDSSGRIAFVGRIDHQVKIRGYRIEPGEIEAVLLQHTAVQHALVVAYGDTLSGKQLAAYVTLHSQFSAADVMEQESADQLVEQWAQVWDRVYHDTYHQDRMRAYNTVWSSSYTNEPIPLGELEEWLACTVERIRLLDPSRILEIGCGTGALLERLAPHCEIYYGTDLSYEGLQVLRAHLPHLELDPAHITLLQRPANDLAGLPTGLFDTVILNSVVQYFPDIDYLMQVIEQALALLAVGGRIFIGDVRCLPRLELFHTAIQLYRAQDDVSKAQLYQRIQQQIAYEQELVISPAYFTLLQHRFPQITGVEIQLKRGKQKNELNLFRYDVILITGTPNPSVGDAREMDWSEHPLSLAALQQMLQQEQPMMLRLTHIADARLQMEKQALNWVKASGGPSTIGEWRGSYALQNSEPALDPNDLWDLEEVLPYTIALTWQENERGGGFTALFTHHSQHYATMPPISPAIAKNAVPGEGIPLPWHQYANRPLQGRLQQEIVLQLREMLQQHLPGYMIPAAIVVLKRFPTTSSGKVDRKALPLPDQEHLPHNAWSFIAPRTPRERLLATIWRRLFGIEHIGIHDNFFALGGDSLLAIQAVALARSEGLSLTPQQFFLQATIAEQSVWLDQEEQMKTAPAQPPVAAQSPNLSSDKLVADIADAEALYPLTPMQQGIFFHHLYSPAAGEYIEVLSCSLPEPLELEAFQQAWRDVIQLYPAFRTSYQWDDDQLVQVVHHYAELPLTLYDYRNLSPDMQQTRLAEHIQQERQGRSFDLATPPLMHIVLLRLDQQRYHLLWSIHHLPLDGWSLPLVLREVMASYQAYCHGRMIDHVACSLTPQYLHWFQQQNMEEAEHFWRRELQGFLTPTLQQIRRAPQHTASQEYAERELIIPAPVTAQLTGWRRAHNLTLNTLLLGAIALLLGYYSNENDVVFGTVVAGRSANLDGMERAIGNFLNTMPVRVQIAPGTPLLTWLHQLQAHQALARCYEYCPIVQVQQWSELPSEQHLFECVFVLDYYAEHRIQLEQTDAPTWHYRMETLPKTGYPLHIWAIPGQEIVLRFTYRQSFFDDETIAWLQQSLGTLLASVPTHVDSTLEMLPFLSEEQRQQQIQLLSGTQKVYPAELCIQNLFDLQVQHTPQAHAIVSAQQTLTYQELDAKANQLGWHLRSLGVKPGVVVGMCVERSLEAIVAMLAILKAEGAFLPLDASYPLQRISYMLRDSGARLLLFHEATAERVLQVVQEQPDLLETVLSLDETAFPPTQACASATRRDTAVYPLEPCKPLNIPEDIAYIMYTSGSTGLPKGVPISHGNMAPFFQGTIDYFAFRPTDRIIQYHNLSFDFSTWEIFEALLSGACLYLIPPTDERDIGGLVQYLRTNRITVLNMTPSQFATLIHYVEQHDLEALSSLRILVLGGEALTTELARAARRLLPAHCQLFNEYGPTETTISCSIFPVTEQALATYANLPTMPIGRAITNMNVYVLDRTLNPVPPGVTGEIYIGGLGVGGVYLNRPQLTAERFLPDVWSTIPGARLYQTGDLAYVLADGNIEFLQRKDHQVKLRGYRIELGEIETLLLQHPSVKETIVCVYDHQDGDKVLVGYIVSKENHRSSATALRDFLEQRLPSYMIPASFLFLDRLPLTVNGKVDRKALPEPERSRDLLETEYVAPISATEQTIAHIWSEVLGIDQIGSQDNFFLLGGHSLLATQVYTRLRRALQIDIPLRVLFEAPTITELAIQVERVRQDIEAQTPPIDTIPTGKLEGPLPLSFAQERLWFLEQLQPGSPQYTIAMAVRIEGLLNLTFLRSSLTYLLERHAILRSVYTFREGTPVQHIQPVEDFALPLQDVTSEAEALSILQAEGTRPFDLIYGPLLHAQVLRIDSACHILFLAFHHSVVDGWSLGIIIRDLAISYQAAMTDQQPDLPPLAIQYPDYARWQRSSAHQSIFTGQLAYWQRQLHEPPVLELPLDHPRPLVMSGRGAVHTQTWNTALLQQLHDCSNHEGVTLFMLLLAAFQVLVMRYSGQEDLIIGSPIANRTRVETEELVGCFVNTLPLRADLHGNPNFRQFLTRIRAIVLEAYEHQDIPFEQVVQELPIERHLNRSPLVQVLFVLQNAPLPTHHIPGLQWHGWPVETQTAKFEITWQLEETEQGLTSRIEYATDLFTEATIARMQQHYQQLLHSILLDCTQPIWQLNLLAPAERVTLLQHWSVTKAEVPAFAYIDELFEQQALRTPEREALYCNGEHLTYLELEQRANQFAHYLRSQGVGPEITVGICLEREPELLIALLGTLKAGGAYVPLDPHYPAARQTYMLEDSRAQVLVTRLSQVLSHTPTRSCQVLAWEQFQPTLATQPVTRPDRVGRYPEQLAYLIYTSGSTGQPKGASITHRSAVNLLAWAQQTFSPTQLAHVLASTSICFDLSIFEIFAPLCVGGRVIMVKNLLQLIDADFREEITLINTVPSAITALMRAQRLPSHVQVINLAGETYQPQIVTAIYEQCPSVQLWNLYGPSETTTYSSGALITTDAQDVTTIGRPLMNTEIYVLDRYGQPVAVGLVGEIYIGGAGLARCYFQRPDLTAERFVPHPWSLTPGARLYYTGDRARYNPDGQLHFLGRSDTQVKLRGFRIEPDEIGRALCHLPFVQEAAIVLREIRPGEQGLVAYLVGVMEDQISDEALREHLRQWLPDYMLPVVFMRLPALPLTPSGKLDKRALPHPSLRHPFEHGSYAAPKTELEQALVTIWQEVLQIDSPGVLDNFFDLGGHSLLLLQLYSKIQERLGYDITVVDLFQYPTIQALATFLSGKSSQLALQRASRDRADTRKTLMKQQQTLRRSRSAQ